MPGKFMERLEAARGLLLLLFLAPLAFAFRPMNLAWDDTYYLHNAVCVERAFWRPSLSHFDTCLANMAKSPIMAMLLIPAGPVRGNLESLLVAPFVLTLIIASLVLLLARLTAIARVPLSATLLAAIAAIATPQLWNNGVPFLVDGVLAVIVVDTVMMLFVEWESPTVTNGEAISRAGLWALLLTLGLFSKVTYAVIVLLLAPAALTVTLHRSGKRATAVKLVALIIFLIPAFVAMLRYGRSYLMHAQESSFGALAAEFYNDGLSRLQFLAVTFPTVWPAVVGFLLLGCWAIFARAERGRIVLALWAVAVLVFYVILATGTPAKEPRYFWMIWLTLPFCAAGAVAPTSEGPAHSASWKVLSVLLIFALALPTLGRVRLDGLRQSLEIMARLPSKSPVSVVLATDEPNFNIETMLLAQELDWPNRSRMNLRTVVYDIATNKTPDKSLETLAQADIVLGRFPLSQGALEWTNRFVPVFEEALRKSGRRVELTSGSQPISIFSGQPTETK